MLTCVRHGESAENLILHQAENPEAVHLRQANPPLTDTGRAQAAHTAKHLVKLIHPSHRLLVWTSQLDRAISTTAPLLEELRLAGVPFEYQERADLNEKKESIVGVKDNESLAAFIPRVEKFVRSLDIEESTHVLIVGHSVFISVLTSLLENPDQQLDDLVYCNPNCGITRFERQKLLVQGSIDHLPTALQTGVNFVRN
jgi:broad specificity phosphatase PhoE